MASFLPLALRLPRSLHKTVTVLVLLLAGLQGTAYAQRGESITYTYSQHIAPIVQVNCVPCHKPNGAGPFPLTTYAEVARHRQTIKAVTKSRYMPPWKADPHYVSFANERRLTDQQIQQIQQWVDAGAPQGPKLRQDPVAASFMGLKASPDLVLKPKEALPIKGNGLETFVMFKIPFELPAGQAVQAIEFVPGNRQLLHHANFAVQEVDKSIDIHSGSNYVLSDQFQTNLGEFQPLMQNVTYYGGWIPGASPQSFPADIGFTMPQRGVVLLTVHYGVAPKDTSDWSRINFYFTKAPIKRTIQATSIGSGGIGQIEPPLVIPADSVKSFQVKLTTSLDLSVLYVWPHMHLLGKKFKAWATTPQGQYIPLVSIPDWDFRWQESYRFRHLVHVPKGSTITVQGVYDNTANNPNNPFSPPRMVISQDLMESRSEMLNLIMLFLDYVEGDEK